jgi:hypothetical protein
LATGHLSFELGGPRQVLGTSLDPEFDGLVLDSFANGDAEGLVAFATYERMLAAGNLTFQFLNFLTCLAAAGNGRASIAEGTSSRFGSEPFLSWANGQ